MAKKYYWLKLKEDFFRNKKIKKLRKIAGGDTYTVIYLKMQLLSLQNEGTLIYEGVENSFAEEIALEIDEDIDNVKITLSFLSQNGLLEEISQDHFIMTETVECIGSEGSSAERVRKHRALKQQKVLQCNAPVTNGNTEIEKEKEIDIDLEKDKKKESKKDSNYDTIINKLVNDEDIKEALYEFIKMRKLIKKPMTDRALTQLIGKLFKLSSDKEEQLQILDNSIINNWSSLYPLKNENNNKGYKRVEIVPEWFNKNLETNSPSQEETDEMEAILGEITGEEVPFEVRKQALQEKLRSKYGKSASNTIIN